MKKFILVVLAAALATGIYFYFNPSCSAEEATTGADSTLVDTAVVAEPVVIVDTTKTDSIAK